MSIREEADDNLLGGKTLCGLRCNPSCFYRSNGFWSPFCDTVGKTETLLTRLIHGNASQYEATFKTTEALLERTSDSLNKGLSIKMTREKFQRK